MKEQKLWKVTEKSLDHGTHTLYIEAVSREVAKMCFCARKHVPISSTLTASVVKGREQ